MYKGNSFKRVFVFNVVTQLIGIGKKKESIFLHEMAHASHNIPLSASNVVFVIIINYQFIFTSQKSTANPNPL